MTYPYPSYGFNVDQQGYPGGSHNPSSLPYPLSPGGPQPEYSQYSAGPQTGYSQYSAGPQSGYSQYPTGPQSGYSQYQAGPQAGYSQYSTEPSNSTYGSSYSPQFSATAPYGAPSSGHYALGPSPSAPAGLPYETGPSGLPYAGATPAGYQTAGYQPTGYQSTSYQSTGYQPTADAGGYPSLYPSIPVSGQPATYPGGSQYPARSNFPQNDGPVAPVPSSSPAMNSTETPIPTVVPANPFDARQDAERLHMAFKGFGSDKDAIINILCRRTSIQRIQIVSSYKSSFGKDLTKRLISELSGDMERVMVALSTPLFEYLASELHHSMAGLGTREKVLIEILCPATNFEIHSIKSAYQTRFGRNLETDIKSDTSGHFERVLVALIQGMRDEGSQTNVEQAINDARRLYGAGEKRLGTEESAFINILATRSWAQIRLIMAEYTKVANSTLEKAVASEFSGDIQKALLTILQCASNRSAYFATCLRACTAGLGTRDRDLIRLLVSHCDTDLGSIKHQYRLLYNKELAKDVANDTSGHYQKALLSLIGP